MNMLCSTMHSFVPLQVGYKAKDLAEVDNVISESILRKNGLTTSDSRHRIFLSENKGGLGFVSLLDQDVISVSREMEIISNLPSLDGRSFRTRIQATHNYNDIDKEDIVNHAKESIEKLARYGIFVRDKQDDLINNILGKLNESSKFPSIGTGYYKDGNQYSIGSGKSRNEQLALGGAIYRLIKSWKNNKWKLSDSINSEMKSCKLNLPHLINIKNEAMKDRFMSIAGIFSFWEWRNNDDFSIKNISEKKNHWEFFDIPIILKRKFPKNYLLMSEEQIRIEASKIVEMKGWNKNATNNTLLFNPYEYHQKIIKTLVEKKVPLIISTDGAHSNPIISRNTSPKSTSSAFTISLCDIKEGESIQSGQWLHRPTIPLLSRATVLPLAIGNTSSDIATGELFAIALSELSIAQDLPRIIITDSKSTRDLLLELRRAGSLDSDRIYTRKIVGGVSKFIFHIFQKKFLNLNNMTFPSSPHEIRDNLKNSMKKLNTMAKMWTESKSINQDKENKNVNWNPNYWDDNDLRTIWKIDSHQLNNEGTEINNSPRYANLIPNLGILSTNHHADVSAEYVSTFNQQLRNIKIMYSALRFSLTWEGKTIDRHISPFIKSKIECERIKRLRSKPTQGLIWRVEQHTSKIWEIFHLHKGIFRCMLGFSRTHTRCLYKNETYRSLCKDIRLTQNISPEDMSKLKNSKRSQDLIDILSPCMWCSLDKGQVDEHKGNRRHMFLYCNHIQISSFRNDMNSLINQHLRLLYMKMAETTSWNFVNETVLKISNGFIHHQLNHTGRLKKLSSTKINSYLSLSELYLKWGQDNLISTIEDERCSILLDIFGITPEPNPFSKGDEEIGIIDLPWLGFIPNFLNSTLLDACTQLDGVFRPTDTRNAISKHLCTMWEEIKELILGRAIGLHRVTGTTGKTMEKIFDEQIIKCNEKNDDRTEENSTRDGEKSEVRDQAVVENIMKRSLPSPSIEALSAKKRAKNDDDNIKELRNDSSYKEGSQIKDSVQCKNTQDYKDCQGITCGNESIFWCQDSMLDRNKIRIGIKQCQRCGRFMTAMKHAQACLSQSIEDPNNNICNEIVSFCTSHPHNLQFQYTSFTNLLNPYLGGEQHPKKAKNINKKTPERFKQICKIIHRSILHSTKQHDVNTEAILFANKFIQKTISKINQKHINHKEAKRIISPTTSLFTSKCYISKQESNTSKVFLSIHAISANSPNTYLPGGAISHAVEVLRARLTWNIFIAHADAYININNWTPNQSWATFGRIFTSQRVLDRKPNGIYLIPFFSGNENSGHWHLIAIEKRRHFCEGWHIDSLGKGSEDLALQDKLQQAFLPGRGRFVWHHPRATQQTECECGPRMIVAMDRIDKNIATGHTTAQAISEALLSHISVEAYDSKSIRLEAALLLETHVRNSTPRLDRPVPTDLDQPAQKRRRIRKKGNSTTTVVDLT